MSSFVGNKILPGAICSTSVTLTAYLPCVFEIWSPQCFHNPSCSLTLEEWTTVLNHVLWGLSLLRSIIVLLPYGFSAVSGASTLPWATLALPPGQGDLDPGDVSTAFEMLTCCA